MAIVSSIGLSIADNTVAPNGRPQTTSTVVPITTLTAANVVAQLALVDTLITATNSIILGNLYKEDVNWSTIMLNALTPATEQEAQREKKWLVRYHDSSSYENFQISIGTADWSLLPDHEEFLDLTAGVGLAWKTAAEAIMKSPSDPTHTIEVDSIQKVGRTT